MKNSQNKQVLYWLITGVIMLMVQIALGGITRLTGSGLSITQWDVITGSMPPLTAAGWLAEFDKYKQTPQFNLLNSDFGISEFKTIYFWEWFHRLWARLLGLVFAVGFAYFLVRKRFTGYMWKSLIILFILGGLQGAVGWIMVQSGLVGDAVYVKPTKLALHFLFAMLLISYTWWFALKVGVQQTARKYSKNTITVISIILVILTVQLGYGALMAGHKAATAAATWPSINGYLLNPPGLINPEEGWLNLIENKITIHFIHRLLAYILTISIIWMAIKTGKLFKPKTYGFKIARLTMVLVVLQVVLGILSVLNSKGIMPGKWGSFEWLALAHQLTGMSLLLAIVGIFYAVTGTKFKVV